MPAAKQPARIGTGHVENNNKRNNGLADFQPNDQGRQLVFGWKPGVSRGRSYMSDSQRIPKEWFEAANTGVGVEPGVLLDDRIARTFRRFDKNTERECELQLPHWKRILDMTCVVLTLPVWLTLMILLTLWVKIASPGPIIYRQERIGYRGRRFMILKFRSMKLNVDTTTHERHLADLLQSDRPMTKLDASGDSRLIPGGRLIRATGLDELPQILNVLRGDMSLVGPRPCTPHEFQHYQPWQQERVNVPPGLTGYWQVNGKNKTTFSEMIAMDLEYAKQLSPWMDLLIIVRTIPALAVQVLETRTSASREWIRKAFRGNPRSAQNS